MSYASGLQFSATYDDRMRPTRWNVAGVLGYEYFYDYFNEKTGRVTYARSLNDDTLDRSYEYDHVGRLVIAHSGAEARAHAYTGQWGTMDGPFSLGYEYDVYGNQTKRYGWGGILGGTPGSNNEHTASFSGNRRAGFTYDAAGNLTFDLGQNFSYDADQRQVSASYGGYSLNQSYDGDRLRVKKVENGASVYYLRSSVLGGRVVAEVTWNGASWQWNRGYVYLGSQLLATQQDGVYFVHEDPVTKSKRVTNTGGGVVSRVELDPYGADTTRNDNAAFQPKRFTTYERDANGSDEAMHRRYNRWHSRFDQPDPFDGSYNLTDPQSLNRYSYTQSDPVNFIDPSGLNAMNPDYWSLGENTFINRGIGIFSPGIHFQFSSRVYSSDNGRVTSGNVIDLSYRIVWELHIFVNSGQLTRSNGGTYTDAGGGGGSAPTPPPPPSPAPTPEPGNTPRTSCERYWQENRPDLYYICRSLSATLGPIVGETEINRYRQCLQTHFGRDRGALIGTYFDPISFGYDPSGITRAVGNLYGPGIHVACLFY